MGVNPRGRPLRLYITGASGGYVEMKLDPDSGALYEVVVVDLPPLVEREVEAAPVADRAVSPVLDRELWPWRITPDYREPMRRDIDITEELAYSRSSEVFSLLFSSSRVSSYLACENVKVGLSEDSELVSIVTPSPPIIEPELFASGVS
jgi:hypothetical protein